MMNPREGTRSSKVTGFTLGIALPAIAVTLGAGKPLLPRRLELILEETGRNGDFVTVRYSVRRPDGADA